MRIRIGDERKTVKRADAPVHGRIRGKPRFKGMDFTSKAAKAFFHRAKTGKRTENRKMRCPDVGWDENGIRAGIQRERKQVCAIKPQDGPPVRMDVADGFKPLCQRFRSIEPR